MDNFVGQSAIEYLMTYGWMLLVVAVVGGAVFSVTQGQSVETVSGFTGSEVGIDEFGATSTGEMQIQMRNTASDEIKINSINISDSSGQTSWSGDQSISVSETGIITVENVTRSQSGSNTLDVTINYDSGSLKNLEASGKISGAFEVSGSSDSPGATGPTAQASANVTEIVEGESVAFDGSASSGGDSSITSYSWNFGDGNTSSGENANHVYGQSGSYSAVLTVENTDGDIDTDSLSIDVQETLPGGAAYLRDSWGDNKLVNRDSNQTISYNGVEGVYRPEWVTKNGNPSASSDSLVLQEDAVMTNISLNLSKTVVWRFNSDDVTSSNNGYRSHTHRILFSETDTLSGNTGAGEGVYESYAVHRRPRNNAFNLIRIDNADDRTTLINGYGELSGSEVVNITVTRTPQGEWELFTDKGGLKTSYGSATDTNYTNPQYAGFVATDDQDYAAMSLDSIEVVEEPKSNVKMEKLSKYSFDSGDTQGGEAVDTWSQYNASISGVTTGVSAAPASYSAGEAYSFDGDDDQVQTPIPDVLDRFSFAAWAKIDSISGNEQAIISTRSSSAGAGLRERGNDKWNWYAYDSDQGSFRQVSTSSLNTDEWYHFVGVVDQNQMRLYVNGSLVSSQTFGEYRRGTDIRIGNRADGGAYFPGDIDDVRIYRKPLSDSEVTNLYSTGNITGS